MSIPETYDFVDHYQDDTYKGAPSPIVERIGSSPKNPPYPVSISFSFFSLATFLANGAEFLLSTNTGTVTIGKRQIHIEIISSGAS